MSGAQGGALATRGIALGLYPDGGSDPRRFDALVDEIADTGASHIALVVTWAQRDIEATAIAPAAVTIDDATARRAIARAHERGLAALVFPILTVERLREGQWRGTLAPRDVDAWWASYERFILHYAGLAAAEGAGALLIGSELSTTEAWRDRWYHLISRVQGIYGGSLLYSANWDHYRGVSFWRRVDAIGVSGYFPLAERPGASVAELCAAWQPIRRDLVAYARAQGKPLLFTELGYLSRRGAAVRPWDYGRRAPVDLDEQRRAYEAFVRAWRDAPELAGVYVWNWWGAGGPDDGDYTPKGKPAETVLRRWFAQPRQDR